MVTSSVDTAFRVESRPAQWFVGLGGCGSFRNAREWVMPLWREFVRRADELPTSFDRSAFVSPCHGRYAEFTFYVGFIGPDEPAATPPGMVRFPLPARDYAVGPVRGPCEAIDRVYAALPTWAKDQKWREVNREILWLEAYPQPPSDDADAPFDYDIWLPLRDPREQFAGHLLGAVTHVQLPARDLDAAVRWYVETLGFETYRQPHGDLAILKLRSGPTLFLWRTDDATTANFTRNGEEMPAIGISCAHADALRTRLEAAGAEIVSHHVEGGFATFLKFRDPDGNMIVAHEDHRR